MNVRIRGLFAAALLAAAFPGNAGPVRAVPSQAGASGAALPSISAGRNHTCELIGDGTVRCWGNDSDGQLGDGTTKSDGSPVTVSGISDAVAVVLGGTHACALRAGGTVNCWGSNQYGELGDGTTVSPRSTPVTVSGLSSAITLAAGSRHTCALKPDGSVACWGLNQYGQLGDGTTTGPRTIPVVASGLTNVVSLAAGESHTCALRANGTVACWGANSDGQLGDGTTLSPRRTPVTVGALSGVVSIVAGARHTCALKANGSVACWGLNQYGQLGDGTLNSPGNTPGIVSGLNNIVAITAGNDHNCALKASGVVVCWGRNSAGQLGDGTTTTLQLIPVQVVGLTNVMSLAAGDSHTCALAAQGGTQCWGANASGQLGDRTTRSSNVPVISTVTRSISAADLAAGLFHSCALRANASVACWGANPVGQIGDGTISGFPYSPVSATGLTNAVSLAASGVHSCALRADGTVACWGRRFSDVEDLVFGPLKTPSTQSGLTSIVAVVAGNDHLCAVVADGTARCMGRNSDGQLGDGTTTTGISGAPVTVSGLTNVVSVAVGNTHSCALRANGTVACWGANSDGQVGDGTTTSPRTTPVNVTGLTNVVAIAAGFAHTCALLADGTARCWGGNASGQVGDGTTSSSRTTPVTVSGLANLVALAAGDTHTCALLADGTARCWGGNDNGQLGFGTTDTPRLTPVPVTQLTIICNSLTKLCSPTVTKLNGLASLTAGSAHTCALQATGAPYCWGRNDTGQLGDGTRTQQTRPVEVPSFRFNISPVVALRSPGRVATVTALINCPSELQAKIEITLRQGSAVGRGTGMRACSGGLDGYEFTVPAQNRESFTAGPADAQAEAVVLDHGTPVDTQTWTRKVVVTASQ